MKAMNVKSNIEVQSMFWVFDIGQHFCMIAYNGDLILAWMKGNMSTSW